MDRQQTSSRKVSISKGKKTGAQLVVQALEQLPVSHTFGIPGVHVTELYDALNQSSKIHPVLVTHESGAAFMADALSRTDAAGGIGVLVIVPAAGMTHAMSGIGEAYLDGIPMLIISGGIRQDTGRAYQLHDIDQLRIMEGITKKAYRIENHQQIIPTIIEAYEIAVSGEPGPVFIELPANIQLFRGDSGSIPAERPQRRQPPLAAGEDIEAAAELLQTAKRPGIFLGWGARDCADLSIRLAEILQAPVATTLQGLSVFPADHPLHTGMGFSAAAVPAAQNAFADCDCLLAVGLRFSEIPTGSFSIPVPENLIHIDINPEVFQKNYPARVAITADARAAMEALLAALGDYAARPSKLADQIRADKTSYREEWHAHLNDRVNPALFFDALRNQLDDNAIMVADDGNHTFLCAELFPVKHSRHFISPTDFNCMGYCVPAAIGAKLVNPEKQVVGIVGDGAFLMTCMEILTASLENLGIVYFVFHDGELAQIAQGQEIPYNRKTCTVLGNVKIRGIAEATGAAYFEINQNAEIESIIPAALEKAASNQPVIVDVRIDYSKQTRFTKGVVKAVSGRFPLGEKIRFVGRALLRKVTG